jgi:histidine phosphotransferase ChpT
MSGTHGALRIIELTSALLCHDFGGLVGALDGGSASASPDRSVSDAAMARIRLRRAAWESADDPVPLTQVAALAGGLPVQVRLDISSLEPTIVFPASTGRVLLNLLLLANDSLPTGGVVTLAGDVDDLFLRISGRTALWPTGLALCVADETAARAALSEARSLQMAITTLLAHAGGIRLSMLLPPAGQDQPAILRLGGG